MGVNAPNWNHRVSITPYAWYLGKGCRSPRLDLHRYTHSIDGTISKAYQVSKKSQHSLTFPNIFAYFFSRGWNAFVVFAERRRCTGEITLPVTLLMLLCQIFCPGSHSTSKFSAASRRDFVGFEKVPACGGNLFCIHSSISFHSILLLKPKDTWGSEKRSGDLQLRVLKLPPR